MARRIAWAGISASLVSCVALAGAALGAPAGHAASTACSTRGLQVPAMGRSGYRVVKLNAEGVACTKARSVARQVAGDLSHNRTVSLPGIVGIAMFSTSCTGCTPTTQVAISYPKGKVTVSLRGAASPPAPVEPGSPVI